MDSLNILVTNNPLAEKRFRDSCRVEYLETDFIGVLINVRNHIHSGCQLLTHPLSGSVKPNETLYKSVLLSEGPGDTDPQSVGIIEESIQTARKFPQKPIPEQYLHDMQLVDLSLLEKTRT